MQTHIPQCTTKLITEQQHYITCEPGEFCTLLLDCVDVPTFWIDCCLFMIENKIIQIKPRTNSCNCKGLHLCFVDGHRKCNVQWNGTEIGLPTTVVITKPSMLVVSNRHCTVSHNQTEEQATNTWHRETHSNPRDLWRLGENSDTKLSYLNRKVRCRYHMYSTFHVVAGAMLFIKCELWLTLASSCSSCFTAISSLMLNAAVSAGGESGSRLTPYVSCCNKYHSSHIMSCQ